MKNGQRRPIGHPTSLSAIASIVQAGNFLLIFEGETVRVQGQRKTSEKFDHQNGTAYSSGADHRNSEKRSPQSQPEEADKRFRGAWV